MKATTIASVILSGLLSTAHAAVSLNVCNDCTDGVAGGTCMDVNISGCTQTPGTQCFKPTDGSDVTASGVTFYNAAGCATGGGTSHRADQCEVQTDGYCVAAGTESIFI